MSSCGIAVLLNERLPAIFNALVPLRLIGNLALSAGLKVNVRLFHTPCSSISSRSWLLVGHQVTTLRIYYRYLQRCKWQEKAGARLGPTISIVANYVKLSPLQRSYDRIFSPRHHINAEYTTG